MTSVLKKDGIQESSGEPVGPRALWKRPATDFFPEFQRALKFPWSRKIKKGHQVPVQAIHDATAVAAPFKIP